MRHRQSGSVSNGVLFAIFAFLAIAVGLGRGCIVSESRARESIEDLGFSDVRLVDDHRVFPYFTSSCGKDDAAGFEYEATNANGKTVTVTACCGAFFKGCTVRN